MRALLSAAGLTAALVLVLVVRLERPSTSASTKSDERKGPAPEAPEDVALRQALVAAGVRTPEPPAAESSNVVVLGRTLFFDVRLSGNKNTSCSSCHYHRSASSDKRSLAVGEGARGVGEHRVQATGTLLARRAPPLYNRALMGTLFWDGRISTKEGALRGPIEVPAAFRDQVKSALALQALIPPLLSEEMRGAKGTNDLARAPTNEALWAAITERLLADEHLSRLFAAAFPETKREALNFGHVARAIAAFEAKQWTALATPLDAFLAGDAKALSANAKKGAALFVGKAGCVRCHSGQLLTDEQLHALAVPQIGPGVLHAGDDVGGGEYRFRTPPLRNVAIGGPWMHDGAFTTLEGAVRHHLDPRASLASYDDAQLAPELRGTLDRDPARRAARAAAVDPLLAEPTKLDAGEVEALVAFLEALNDSAQVDKLSYRMGPMMMEGMMPPMMASMWEKQEAAKKAENPRKGMAMPLMMGQ